MRTLSRLGLLFLAVVLMLAGCGQKSDQASNEATGAGGAGGAARTAKPAEPPVVLPAGTELNARLVDSLSSKSSNAGDTFKATVDGAVTVNGKTVIPKGAEVTGKVTNAVPSGRLKQRAELWVTLTSVKVGGKTYEISTSATGQKEGSKATREIGRASCRERV